MQRSLGSGERKISVPEEEPSLTPDTFLSLDDRRQIVYGLQVFWEEFSAYPAERLPDMIFYTDTASRPLAYLFRPVIAALYEKVGRHPPQSSFIATLRNDILVDLVWGHCFEHSTFSDAYQQRRREEIRELRAKLMKRLERLWTSPEPSTSRVERIFETQEDLVGLNNEAQALPMTAEKLRQTWEQLVQRGVNAAKHLHRVHPYRDWVNLLVIDEQIYRGNTLKLLEGVFREGQRQLIAEESPILMYPTYFALADMRADRFENSEQDAQPDFRAVLGSRLIVGTKIFNAGELQYAAPPFEYSMQDADERRERVIGVRKQVGEMYVKRSPHANVRYMRYLRAQLQELGESFVASINH